MRSFAKQVGKRDDIVARLTDVAEEAEVSIEKKRADEDIRVRLCDIREWLAIAELALSDEMEGYTPAEIVRTAFVQVLCTLRFFRERRIQREEEIMSHVH